MANVRSSHMETDLDKVEEGDVNWRKMLKDFYGPPRWNRQERATSWPHRRGARFVCDTERCPTCGGSLRRGGFFSAFVACEKHPKDCVHQTFARPQARAADGRFKLRVRLTDGNSSRPLGEFSAVARSQMSRTRSCPPASNVRRTAAKTPFVARRSAARVLRMLELSRATVVWDKPVAETCP